MIDLDPQASLTFSFIRPEDWERNLAQIGKGKELPRTRIVFRGDSCYGPPAGHLRTRLLVHHATVCDEPFQVE